MQTIHYSKEVDALLIELSDSAIAYAEDGQTILHYSDDGQLVLIEILEIGRAHV